MTEPRYQDLVASELPVRRERSVEVLVFSGASGGVTAPTQNHVPVTMLRMRCEPLASFRADLPGDFNAFVVVLEGEARLGTESTSVRAGQVAWLSSAASGDPPS